MKPKNLLFITADQWRGECLSALDHPTVKTPNLDALAEEGVLFRNHFAQCTPCGPSRASLYTGMYLQNHRSTQNGVPLDARHTNIALEMRKLGFDPALLGYTDTTPDPRCYTPNDPVLKTYEGILPGFGRVLAMPSTSFPEPWARWLENNMNIGIYRKANYPRDERSLRQLRATYYGLITEVDDNIGKLVRLLKDTGQYDDTIIVFGSDHGDLLGDHHLLGKGSYFNQNVHIPLIMRVPGEAAKNTANKIVDAFTENIDIFPTILELYGADVPRQCDGQSLLPFLRGETPPLWRSEVHWEVDFRYLDMFPGVNPDKDLAIGYDECCFNVIRDQHYKYVHFTAMPPLFFDLQNDPNELQNLADDPAYAHLVLKYAQKMLSWRMANDERTLTHLSVGPDGVIERI